MTVVRFLYCMAIGFVLVGGFRASAGHKECEIVRAFDRDVYVHEPNYNPLKIAPYSLEDPLKFLDGRAVTCSNWEERRREILAIFAREMYGMEPPAPTTVEIELVDEKDGAAAGFAIRRQYRMWFREDKVGPCVNWIVWIPRFAKKPVPFILFLNFNGNAELVPDKDIPLLTTWSRGPNNDGTGTGPDYFESIRGRMQNPDHRSVFPLGTILSRGYAVMSACYCDVSPDPDRAVKDSSRQQQPFAYTGVFELWGPRDESRDDNITSIGAWAWALSRGLDLATRIPEIDIGKSIVTGSSRLGKAALLAAARDDRFAVCVANQTGGGGAPLAKRDYGENISTQSRMFTHWFCKAYAKYAKEPWKTLPFDQHLLIACVAPRALLVEGFDSRWFDTEGEFFALQAASPVWEMLCGDGLPKVKWPSDYDTSAIGRHLGYVRRSEDHGIAACDWKWMLDFADGVFAEKRSAVTRDFKITDYGARKKGADERPKCTEAFARAIDACAVAGGGRVVVPRGEWFSGSIRLKSNVELHLEEGAEIIFSQDANDYLPAVHTSWEGMECWNYCPLVYAYCCTNVAITGSGTLRGYEGEWKRTAWYEWVPQTNGVGAARLQLYTWGATDYSVEKRQIWKMPNAHTRPQLVQFNRCKNVRWEGFRVRNSPFWTLHLYMCDGVTVRGLDVYAHGNNNDGIDIEMSRNVLVENCTFDQGDDGVVIKSGRNRDAWRLHTPTENVVVRNCRIVNAHSLFCIGSEISGGVRNVRMEDCVGRDVVRAVYVKTNRRRGGFVENISAERVFVDRARLALLAVETDVLYEWARFPDYELRMTRLSGIRLKDVSCREAARRVLIEGDPSLPVEDVMLENVRAEHVQLGEYLESVELFKDDCPTVSLPWEMERAVRRKNPAAVEIGLGRIAPRPGDEEWWIRRHAQKLEEIRMGGGVYDIVFFGDSISHYWELKDKGDSVLTDLRKGYRVLVLGYSGDRTYNALWRARNGELDGYRTKLITVLIGTNNWQENSVSEIAADIRELVRVVRQKQPQAKVLLMPLLPRHEKAKSDKNEVVSRLIESIPDGENIFWLDIREPFTGAPKELLPDGLHPNATGYRLWVDALEPHLRTLEGASSGI